MGVLSGDLEVLADDLRDETPRTALLATAMGQILEKLILEECAVEEAMDLLALGCPMLDTLRYGFETNGEETIEDATTFEQILALGEIGDIDLDVHSSPATTDLTPEAMLIADDAPAGAGADAQFLEEAPPQAQESTHEPVELMEIEVDSDIFADFSSEADEHLHNAENALLLLEGNPEDDELLNTIFRAFHTIKGAAGFLNLTDVTQLSHAVEDVLDSARKKQLVLNQAITDVVLESVDLLKELLQHVEQQLPSGSIMPRDVSAFVAKVTSVVTNKEVPVQPASTSSAGLVACLISGLGSSFLAKALMSCSSWGKAASTASCTASSYFSLKSLKESSKISTIRFCGKQTFEAAMWRATSFSAAFDGARAKSQWQSRFLAATEW